MQPLQDTTDACSQFPDNPSVCALRALGVTHWKFKLHILSTPLIKCTLSVLINLSGLHAALAIVPFWLGDRDVVGGIKLNTTPFFTWSIPGRLEVEPASGKDWICTNFRSGTPARRQVVEIFVNRGKGGGYNIREIGLKVSVILTIREIIKCFVILMRDRVCRLRKL